MTDDIRAQIINPDAINGMYSLRFKFSKCPYKNPKVPTKIAVDIVIHKGPRTER